MAQEVLTRVSKHFSEESEEHDSDVATVHPLTCTEHIRVLYDIFRQDDSQTFTGASLGHGSFPGDKFFNRRQMISKCLQQKWIRELSSVVHDSIQSCPVVPEATSGGALREGSVLPIRRLLPHTLSLIPNLPASLWLGVTIAAKRVESDAAGRVLHETAAAPVNVSYNKEQFKTGHVELLRVFFVLTCTVEHQ